MRKVFIIRVCLLSHAVRVLLFKGIVPQSYEGIGRKFSLYYVKTKEIRVDMGKIIGRLVKMREEVFVGKIKSFLSLSSELIPRPKCYNQIFKIKAIMTRLESYKASIQGFVGKLDLWPDIVIYLKL